MSVDLTMVDARIVDVNMAQIQEQVLSTWNAQKVDAKNRQLRSLWECFLGEVHFKGREDTWVIAWLTAAVVMVLQLTFFLCSICAPSLRMDPILGGGSYYGTEVKHPDDPWGWFALSVVFTLAYLNFILVKDFFDSICAAERVARVGHTSGSFFIVKGWHLGSAFIVGISMLMSTFVIVTVLIVISSDSTVASVIMNSMFALLALQFDDLVRDWINQLLEDDILDRHLLRGSEVVVIGDGHWTLAHKWMGIGFWVLSMAFTSFFSLYLLVEFSEEGAIDAGKLVEDVATLKADVGFLTSRMSSI